MNGIDVHQLASEKSHLEEKLKNLEQEIQPLVEEIAELRGAIQAIDQLLAYKTNGGPMGRTALSAEGELIASALIGQTGSLHTPADAYWVPILETLVELGGSARGEEVVNRVGQRMRGILKPGDCERLPSGVDIRWRNRCNWQRFNMVRQGILRSGSPRGVWQISEEGRQWLARKTRGSSSNGRMQRIDGKQLNEHYELGAKQARYREDGRWYHALEDFPAVLFDASGYIRFATKEDYDRCAALRKGPDPNQVHVERGISAIPGYQQVEPPPYTVLR